LINTVKPFKKPWDVLFWNPTTVIGNPNNHLVFDKILYTYFGSSFGQAIFNGVHQQITDYLLYFILIPIYINRFGIFHIKSEGNFLFSSFHLQKVECILNQLNDVKILSFQL